jgi:hypothetical protein
LNTAPTNLKDKLKKKSYSSITNKKVSTIAKTLFSLLWAPLFGNVNNIAVLHSHKPLLLHIFIWESERYWSDFWHFPKKKKWHLTLWGLVCNGHLGERKRCWSKRFYLKEEREREVKISENLMTIKLNVFIHFLFNGRDLIRNIKRIVYFTWNTWSSSILCIVVFFFLFFFSFSFT